MKARYVRCLVGAVLIVTLSVAACRAANPPICPHVIGWNSTIASWAQGAPWIKVIFAGDAVAAKATGAKVFYRPWDADSSNHDDGSLPSSLTGTQYADLVWAKISPMAQKPDAVSYRNEFIPTDAAGKRTCQEFPSYAARLKALGYTGKVVFGSFGVGWVDDAVWNDTDLTAAVNASDGVETHEYFDFDVNCGAPWLAFRHRDIAIANHAYLQTKDWYIGEFGSDRVCNPGIPCSDYPLCRNGWRDNGKLTEQAYITQLAAYRAGCANQVVAVFLFQQGDSVNWGNFEVLGTSVATWMQSTWVLPSGRFAGQVKDTNGTPVPYPTIGVDGVYGAAYTDSSGHYYTVEIPPGTYSITASKSGFGQQTFTGRTIAGGGETTVNFDLPLITSISAAKMQANSTTAVVQGIVTAKFPLNGTPERIYVQNLNRSCGIAVLPSSTASVADLVQAQGTVYTSDGERVIKDAVVTPLASGQRVPKPLGTSNVWLGGGWFGMQSPTLNFVSLMEHAVGMNNIGLLCQVYGSVDYVDPSGSFFYVNDGCGLNDGSGHRGVRIASTSLPLPAVGANVSVTGVSSATMIGSYVARLLRPRSVADLSYASEANHLFAYGFESGTLSGWNSYGRADGAQTGTWFGGVTARSGSWFFGTAANYDAKSGGIYQRAIARSGGRYQAKAWSRVFWLDNASNCVQSRVGIDPNGGTDPQAASVVWSPVDTQATPNYSVWRQLSTPTVTCSGGIVTIFLDFTQTNPAGWHVNCFDDAELRLVP